MVMLFGLCNSLASFQMMMNTIFADLIAEGKVVIYLDNILIFSKDISEHHCIVRQVIEILAKHDLYLRLEKCEFERLQVEYLGVIISLNSVEMDPVKIAGVAEWPALTSKKEVQSFLGFTNFYRQFIRDFSDHAQPLFDLTRNDVQFHWGAAEQSVFDRLKQSVTSTLILVSPDNALPFRIEVDSSDFMTGAVLSQLSVEDDKWHPVAYLLKVLSLVEWNYKIHDKEML